MEHNQEKREKDVKYQRLLLQIIEEEIDKYFLEQVAPPAAPAAPTPPTASTDAGLEPDVSGGGEGDDEGNVDKAIKILAAKTPIEVKKTILSSLQNGAERPDAETLIAYVQNKKEKESTNNSTIEDTDKEIPINVDKAVTHIVQTFKFKVPEKAEKEAEKEDKASIEEKPAETPAAPAAPTSAPVQESKLQTSLREYLRYKQLSQKVKR